MRPLQFSLSLVLGSKGAQTWVQVDSQDCHATHCRRCGARSSPFRPSPSRPHPPEDLDSMCQRYLFSQSSPHLPRKCLSLSSQQHQDRGGADQQERGTRTFGDVFQCSVPQKKRIKGRAHLGWSSPAKPALHMLEPQWTTIGGGNSASTIFGISEGCFVYSMPGSTIEARQR